MKLAGTPTRLELIPESDNDKAVVDELLYDAKKDRASSPFLVYWGDRLHDHGGALIITASAQAAAPDAPPLPSTHPELFGSGDTGDEGADEMADEPVDVSAVAKELETAVLADKVFKLPPGSKIESWIDDPTGAVTLADPRREKYLSWLNETQRGYFGCPPEPARLMHERVDLLVRCGVATVNEVRDLLGLRPLPGPHGSAVSGSEAARRYSEGEAPAGKTITLCLPMAGGRTASLQFENGSLMTVKEAGPDTPRYGPAAGSVTDLGGMSVGVCESLHEPGTPCNFLGFGLCPACHPTK